MYVRRSVQPSWSGESLTTFKGHLASGLYACQAAATAASAFGARTSTNTMCESPSGASRIVAGPRVVIVHPAGAMNVLPSTVVFAVSESSRSGASPVAGATATHAAAKPEITIAKVSDGLRFMSMPPSPRSGEPMHSKC